ncbi:hypothetical protein A6R68_22026, partial [Neotoma lepida]
MPLLLLLSDHTYDLELHPELHQNQAFDSGHEWASCWQPGTRTPTPPQISEDCLYLNVFVPEDLVSNASVLVFFHNTMEMEGSGGQLTIDGSVLAAVGNFIVVTANYRGTSLIPELLGLLHFASPQICPEREGLEVGSDQVAGNWGLLDQVAALTWVQTHIGAFGGDPQRVTLASDRGGADVASIHLLVTKTTRLQLFRRALLMSKVFWRKVTTGEPEVVQGVSDRHHLPNTAMHQHTGLTPLILAATYRNNESPGPLGTG